jgi:hypothetical protein
LALAAVLLAAAALLSKAPAVWAQVAAPPLSPYSFVTENPAAMQWGGPSRLGASYSQAQTLTDPTTVTDNFSGSGVGGRYVGQWLSAAAEYSRLDSVNQPNNIGGEYYETAKGAIGVRLGSFLALGAGQENTTYRIPIAGSPYKNAWELPQAGLSIRLGEWFFLGGSGGTETFKQQNIANTAKNASTSRDVYKYGAGIRTYGSSILTHLEYYVVERSEYGNTNNVAGPLGREDARTGVLEVNFGGFLLGYFGTHIERDSGFATTDEGRAVIGWAPVTGLTIIASGNVRKDTYPQGSAINSSTMTTYSLAVTYLFAGAK